MECSATASVVAGAAHQESTHSIHGQIHFGLPIIQYYASSCADVRSLLTVLFLLSRFNAHHRPLTPVLMYSHKRTSQWQGECLRADQLHQFASEDVCVTSTPKLYADVHFVYAATPGEDGKKPDKVLARAGYIESQLDAYSIDPAGTQTDIVDTIHISSPNRSVS